MSENIKPNEPNPETPEHDNPDTPKHNNLKPENLKPQNPSHNKTNTRYYWFVNLEHHFIINPLICI